MEIWERQLKDIERVMSDRLYAFAETTPQYFSTKELNSLYSEWQERYRLFWAWQRFTLLVGLSSPIWFLLAVGLGLWGKIYISIICLKLFPLSLVLFIAMTYWLKRRFESSGELEYIGQLLQDELKKRRLKNKC